MTAAEALTADTSSSTIGAPISTLIYGDTGTGKTNLLSTLEEYIYERGRELHGSSAVRVLRLYSSDGGGWGDRVQGLMRLGLIQAWRMRNHIEAFETCELASLGYWPDQLDPLTGYASPRATLRPVTEIVFTLTCPNGHLVRQTLDRKLIQTATKCPQCPLIVTLQNGQVSTATRVTPGSELVGGVAFDGLTSMQSWVMADMADRAGRLELEGEKSALGGRIVSGNLVLGANNRAHYGFAQNRAEQWVINANTIPNLIVAPVWTALELRASDDNTKLPIYGPQIAGKAKTSDVPTWYGNCLRTAVAKDEHGRSAWRLYTREHTDDIDSVPHLAKTRTDPDALPEFFTDDPDAPRFSGFSLAVLFRRLDEARAGTFDELSKKYPQAPGVRVAIPAPSSPVGSPGQPPVTAAGVIAGAVDHILGVVQAAVALPPGRPGPALAARRLPGGPAGRPASTTSSVAPSTTAPPATAPSPAPVVNAAVVNAGSSPIGRPSAAAVRPPARRRAVPTTTT